MVRSEPLQLADRKRGIDLLPSTSGLTGSRADAAERAGKRHGFHDHVERFLIPAGLDQGDKALNVDAGRTGLHTGPSILLVDRVSHRHGLGEGDIDGFAHPCLHIPFVRGFDRADLGAVSAAGTVRLHIAGVLIDIDLEVADKTADTLHLGIGHEMDVLVLAHGHHFRRTDTGRTVQGREGLVKLEHVTPDGRLPFHKIGLVA